MAFMIPAVEHFAVYLVETNCGREIVPVEVCGELEEGDCESLAPYLEGTRIENVERVEGFFARLSAPGYLDCTDWIGPFETEEEAMCELCAQYDVDENGEGVTP